MEHSASKRGASIALFIYVQFNHCIAVLDIYNSILATKRPSIGIEISHGNMGFYSMGRKFQFPKSNSLTGNMQPGIMNKPHSAFHDSVNLEGISV
jgi:hypothetical protein